MYFSHNTITPCLALLASSQSMMSLSKAPNSKNITLHNSTAGNFSDIWGSHSGDHEDGTSLGCNVMSPGRSMQAFQSNLLLLSCVLLFQKKKKNPWHCYQGIYLGDAWSSYTSAVSENFWHTAWHNFPGDRYMQEVSLCPTWDHDNIHFFFL